MANEDSLNLLNKIVLLYKINCQHEITLKSSVFETHHDRLFLVGNVSKGGSANDWLLDVKTYIAWDQVEEFSVFDSEEEYLSRLAQSNPDKTLQ